MKIGSNSNLEIKKKKMEKLDVIIETRQSHRNTKKKC